MLYFLFSLLVVILKFGLSVMILLFTFITHTLLNYINRHLAAANRPIKT